jgi:hypothetical protein
MSAMIQDYGSDTVSMVFHSISPRVECEDFFPRGERWFNSCANIPFSIAEALSND